MKHALFHLLAAALAGVALAAERRGSALGSTEALSSQDSEGLPAVFAVGAVLDGQPLASLAAVPSYAGCATACRENVECTGFQYCGDQAGCWMPDNTTLDSQECQLLANANCTLAPAVGARGPAEGVNSLLVSGFPVRSEAPPAMPGLVGTQAQGVSGGDFSCPDSVVEDACAFRDVLVAAFRCSSLLSSMCQSVVVYVNGTGGCQDDLLAVLKTTKPLPDNTYWAPTVYILNKKNEAGTFILYDEATLIPPDNETWLDQMAAASLGSSAAESGTVLVNASAATNSSATAANVAAVLTNASAAPATVPMCIDGITAWMGCVLVDVPAVMGGLVNRTIDSVPSAESCCRACREAGRTACNVFNWCPTNETCSFQDTSAVITLQPQQCELRFQEMTDPSKSIPPYLLGKGTAAGSFRAGAPLSAWGPPLPGYERRLAGGLYGQPGTPCRDSLKPEYQECILSAPLPQLAERCSSDPLCSAIVAKPCGFLSSTNINVGMLRQEQGANASLMVRNPTSVVYFKQQPAAASGGGGLSGGAIAGIAVGCVAAVSAAAAAGWLLVRRQHTKQAAVLDAALAAKASETEGSCGASAPAALALLPGDSARWPEGGLYHGTLGSAPLPASATQHLAISVPDLQRRGSGSDGSSPVLMAAVIGRPTPASPFASARVRMSPAPSSTCSLMGSSSMQGPSVTAGIWPIGSGYLAAVAPSGSDAAEMPSEEGSAPQEEPEFQMELFKVMGEVIQHREQQEAASWTPKGPLSGGQQSTLGTSSSTGTPQSQTFERVALPASLQDWLIPTEEVCYQRRPDGELWLLGEGASARVIRAELRGEIVAAKVVEVGRGLELQKAFISEAQQLCNLRHACIVQFYGVCVDEGKGILLTELCEGRDLGSLLQLEKLPGQRVFGWYRHGCRVAYEVATALNYLHSRNIAHMDIKSSNVLLTSRGMAKLGDVGLARIQTRTVMSDLPQMIGTFAWVAPEVLLGGQGCTLAVDIFSYGVLLWEIITGLRPVRGNMRSIQVPVECPQEVADMMGACCALDPAARPSARDLMKQLQAMLVAQKEGRHSELDGSRSS